MNHIKSTIGPVDNVTLTHSSEFTMEDDIDENSCLNNFKNKIQIRNSVHIAPVLISFSVIGALLALYGIVYAIDGTLPPPLKLSDEETHPDAFITERARDDLQLLTNLGSRIAGGSENEIEALEFLKNRLNLIIQNAHKNQKLELDVQLAAGSHYLNRSPHGNIMAYSNLQNIIVKLHARSNVSQTVLVNAHFDSVPTSPGASDDAINCAVMLEILRKLSKKPQRPLNNVIFLFNGAEEPGLQASHGFITKHKWAKDCKVVLNLEAAGSGGKIILFQTGPSAPWLMKYYTKVPHPYGQAAGEEIFQNNLVPSDTDFRIFRDYGGLVGLDMAFFKTGYVYHTKYDDFERIPPGSFQHVGDNALSLVSNLANAPEVRNPKENPGKVIFFDFLGLFMISYSQTVAHIVNYIVVLLSFIIFALSIHSFELGNIVQIFKYLALTFGAIIGGWIGAVVFVIIVALFIDKIGYSMSWYANPWLIFGLYVTPTVAFCFILLPWVNCWCVTANVKSQIQVHCVRIIWTVILFIGAVLNIGATYALLIPILFNTAAFIVIYLLNRRRTLTLTERSEWKKKCQQVIPVKMWQTIYVIFLIIPTMFLMYTQLTSFSLFVPITGRIGSDKNADLIIGIFSLFFTILIASPFVTLAAHFRNIKFLLIFFGTVFAVSFIIVFTPLGFPYTGNKSSPAPQRYWIIHTNRVFHNESGFEVRRDSGYFLLNMDRNSPDQVKSYVKELDRARSLEDDCKNHLMCGLPIVHSKMVEIIKHSTWIPAEKAAVPEQTKLEVLSKVYVTPTRLRYNISVAGPDRVALYLSPKRDVKLLNISLLEKITARERTAVWNERDLYYIFYIYGKAAAPLSFTFDVKVPGNADNVTTEIAVCGIYVHDYANRKIPQYERFLSEFPDWTDVTAWLGSFESWWI